MRTLLLLFLITALCCQSPETLSVSELIEQEIELVRKGDQLLSYLETIFELDQDNSLPITHLPDRLNWKIDTDNYKGRTHHDLNMERVFQIYHNFPFPALEQFGEKAYTVMWVVPHHNYSLENTKKFFPLLREHHLKGNIKSDNYRWYLNRRISTHGEGWKQPIPKVMNDSIERVIALRMESTLEQILTEKD